jgi:hypothetical protein
VFIVVEWFFLAGKVRVRGSISAYFHTGARDVFVGGLCVIAFMLTTYLAGQFRRPDYWLSSIAGVALLLVVFFPTGRPDVAATGPFCGAVPQPPGCAALQQALGEKAVATVHFVAAMVFILCLAVISWYWARREDAYGRAHDGDARVHDSARSGWGRLQRACALAIAVAVAWVAVGGVLGLQIWRLTPLYVGEVVAVWAFAVAWLARSRDWWRATLGGPVLPAQPSRQQRDPT